MIATGRMLCLAAGCLALSACAGMPAAPQAPAAPPPAVAAPAPQAAPQAQPPVPPAAAPLADEASLRAQLGAPDFVRKEDDAELWRYDGRGCQLFAFLYREDNALKVRRLETVP